MTDTLRLSAAKDGADMSESPSNMIAVKIVFI
jgi:hypothetical protein